jgi:hypothetical protein
MTDLYNENKLNKNLSDVDVISYLINKNHKFHYKILEKDCWFDIGNINSLNKALNYFKCDYDVLHKDNEAICFIGKKVIKFINNNKYNLNKIERASYLYPIVPKIINKGNYFFSMELVEGIILSKIKKYGEIYKLLNWAYENLWINKQVSLNFKKYSVFHIRSGDDYLNKDNKIFLTKYFEKIKREIQYYIKSCQPANYLIIADNNEIKILLKKNFPKFKIILKEITHFGEGVDLEEEKVKNTLIDFYLLSFANKIISLSTYKHGSGFSYWCAQTFDVPYIAKYIE